MNQDGLSRDELILKALGEYSCSTTIALSNYIKRQYKEDYSPATISGVLRKYVARGKVAKSNCGMGYTSYWIVKA